MGLGSGKSGSLESDTEVRKLKVYTEIRYLLRLRFGIIGVAGGIFFETSIESCPWYTLLDKVRSLVRIYIIDKMRGLCYF